MISAAGFPPLPENPLVSVIIPAYNMAECTRQTVDSLLAQDYGLVEVIAVDDGSSDSTPGVLESYGERIRFLRQANQGACRARNLGFSHCKGDLVAFLDCDDLWEPGKARRCVDYFRGHPRAGMVYSHAYWIDARGEIVGPRDFSPRPQGRVFRTLFAEDHVVNSTPVMRREALERVGPWDESIFTTADWDLWLRLALEFEVGFIQEALSRTRVASRYNGRNIERTRRETLYLIEKHRAHADAALVADSMANMHFYLSRLHAANGDFRSARLEALQGLGHDPWRFRLRAAAALYALGGPVNRLAQRGVEAYTRWACRLRSALLEGT